MREYSELKWKDDYRIIGLLFPELFKLKDRFDNPFKTPFDPHDAKYFDVNIYKNLNLKDLPDGVRVKWVREYDLTFDEDGNERIRKVKLCYFRVNKEIVRAKLEQDCTAWVTDGLSA